MSRPTLSRRVPAVTLLAVASCLWAAGLVAPGGSAGPARSHAQTSPPQEVRLLSPGSGPRVALRYAVGVGARETATMALGMSMSIGVGGVPAQPVRMPVTRMQLEMGPIEAAPQGRLRVPYVFMSVQITPGNGVAPELVTAMQTQMQPLIGLRGFQVIDPRGVGHGAGLTVPPNTAPELAQRLEQLSSSMKNMTSPFPEEAVGVGAVWEVRSHIVSNQISLDQVATYRLRAMRGSDVEMDLELSQTAPPQNLNIPQPGVTAHLDSMQTTGSGQVRLNLAHVTPNSSLHTHTEMHSTISAQGQQQPMRMEMDMDVTFSR